MVKTAERREAVLKVLKQSTQPITAKELAMKFGVSRQVIVQDISIIRLQTPGIVATNNGYYLEKGSEHTREYKVCHDSSRVEEELQIIVDCGGIVKNVSISHAVYGRISAEMDVRSRMDVEEFIERMNNSKSTILSSATSGYHYHVIEAPNNERLDLIEKKLKEADFLVPLLPWEQEQK